MPNPPSIRRLLTIASLLCLAAPGALIPACSGSAIDDPGATTAGNGAGGASCPLPATAELPPQCVACIHSACPATYDQLCAANCGAAELGAPCLSAQTAIGHCLQSNCQFECQRTHGSAVGGAGGLSSIGLGGASSGGGGASGATDTANEYAGAGGSELSDAGAAGAAPIAGGAGSGGAADECSVALPLKCGDRLNHSTILQGRPNRWNLYSSTQRAETGRETLYAFSPSSECEVIARLKNLQTDLDLLLVPRCESISSNKASSTPIDLQTEESISWTNPADQTSYVVVDGYSGAEGSYTLEVDCICEP